jgi:hypothetical protein
MKRWRDANDVVNLTSQTGVNVESLTNLLAVQGRCHVMERGLAEK